ncbi:glycosyltransferase family protein [Haloflavibacter putidus]|uniref:Glycosyltransferase family 4 protein n=1 Tax=Haloflavibacter putidus TaxID=2576776 RepID=A0A507ZRA8_9FLAO|nr:glycosyltransferase family 4 protein [Haloflavibacter putidus]TQD40150.1 glycosyltransferase family 4 protein [Haloflavibacter putidus]
MKKVLIVAYYWPPAGGPGVQRWLNFVKYLPEFGIEPIVYVPENPSYPIIDKSLEKEILPQLKIIKKPILEPYKLASLFAKKETKEISAGLIKTKEKTSVLQEVLLAIRGNLFIPDARKFWVKPSVSFLKTYLQENEIKTIITTGPPHSLHLIGLKLQQALNITWIADFRDPWTSIGYHKKLKLSKTSAKKHRELEKEVLQNASHIITTSFSTKKEFEQLTPKSVSVITNGYETYKKPVVKPDNYFTVAHIGSLLSERNPKMLWQALSELTRENKAFKEAFRLLLVGKVSTVVEQMLRKFELGSYLDKKGYVTHEEAIKFQYESNLLLLIEIDKPETQAIIPGKLFEYLYTKKPILAIGPENWDVQIILTQVGAGQSFLYNQKNAIKKDILKVFEAYQENKSQLQLHDLEEFSRKNLTKKLSKLIESAV